MDDSNGLFSQDLWNAARDGDLKKVKELATTENINGRRAATRSTALYIACEKGHYDVIEFLINHGADVNIGNRNKASPLFIATQKGYIDTVKLLISSGADVKSKKLTGEEPIFIAAEMGHVDILKLLLEHGCKDTPRNNGASPLFMAAQNNHKETVEILISVGGNVNLQTVNAGLTPLLMAAKKGCTPLIAACIAGNAEIVSELLDCGADFSIKSEGKTAWEHAISQEIKDLIKKKRGNAKSSVRSNALGRSVDMVAGEVAVGGKV